MSIVALRILGECEIQVGDHVVRPDSPQLFLLLLLLSAESGTAFTRAQLCELIFFGGNDSHSSAHNLRQLLYRLRRLRVPLRADGPTVSVEDKSVSNSVTVFLSTSTSARLARLGKDISVLPQYSPATETAATWLESYRNHQHNALRRQLASDLHQVRRHADWKAVELIATRLLTLDPLNESATLALAECVALTGSKALALTLLDRFERDLGISRPTLSLPAKLLRTRLTDRSTQDRQRHTSHTLVGRVQEMERLAGLWARCREGRFCIVHLHGPEAVGKSRLIDDFRTLLSHDGSGFIVRTQAKQRDKDRPLSMFTAMLPELLSLPGAAGCSPEALPLLRRLTDVKVPAGPIGSTFARSTFDEATVRSALADLLTSVSEERSLLCLVDDAHAVDPASLSMLSAIQSKQPTARIMFVLASRHSVLPFGDTAAAITDIRLRPLQRDDAATLIAGIARSTDRLIDESGIQWILDVSCGSPGHIELLVTNYSSSREGGALAKDLIALIDDRITALSLEAHHVLCAIAIAADGIWASEISAVTGLSDWSTLTALNDLDDAALLENGDDGILCRSAVITERVLVGSSSFVVSLMHERLAERLESAAEGRVGDATLAWRLAGHWKAAGHNKRARQCLRACWQQAISIGQPMSAARSIQLELSLAVTAEDRAELLDDLIGALQAAGEIRSLSEAIKERQALSTRVADSRTRIAVLAFDNLQVELLSVSSPAKYGSELITQLNSRNLDTERRLRAGRLLMMAADELLDEKLATMAHRAGNTIQTEEANCVLQRKHIGLIFHCVFGDRDTAIRITEDIDALVSETEHTWMKFLSRRNCSLARQLVGQEAYDHSQLERDYIECLEAGMHTNARQCAAHLASILIDDGDLHSAKKWLQHADSLVVEANQGFELVDYLSGQVDLALLSGDEARARHFLARMQKNAPRYECGRLRNDLLLYRLRVDQVCQCQQVSEIELAELLRFHELARRFGRHDDHMDVLWVALCSVGRGAQAHTLLQEYLTTHRRERRSCRYFLRQRTKTDPAWAHRALAR